MTYETLKSPVTVARSEVAQWSLYLGSEAPGAPEDVVEALAEGLATTVPSSVLGALIRAGLASDVTVDGREEDVAWASNCSWIYRTTVERRGDYARVIMTFDGIDTLATVRVDGETVLTTDDMFHSWTVELADNGHSGVWHVEVEFHPVLPVARELEMLNPLPRADMYDLPFNQVRKMACSFGWDWGPTTITAGLWRAVYLTRVYEARISSALVTGGWREGALLTSSIKVEGPAHAVVATVRSVDGTQILDAQRLAIHDGLAVIDVAVPGAEQWNVVHRGDQPLYDVELTLIDADDQLLDTVTRRVGFRSVEVVQERDAVGRSFEIHVNGSRVWARGFNWIPADVLPERVSRERTLGLVQDAVETGANMLRVWAGGVVESPDFYAACDEAGILVWQDFSFACAAYAEDDRQMERVRREVADAVGRVGHHASLALWCGCNENLWGHEDWGWKERLGDDGAWGAHLYYDVIPGALAELDPNRPYIPGSPFSPDEGVHPNDPTQGTTHHWDTWNELDYTAFEQKTSRFASEFGWQAPAAWHTLSRAIGSDVTGGDDHRVQRLQKHPQGGQSLARGVADHVDHLPKDGRGWYFSTQLMQARAIHASIGRFRSLHDQCSGTLWWQLNDCWPALSWAVVDVTGARKLGWYASAVAMAPRAVIATAPGVERAVTVVNDVPEAWTPAARIRAVTEIGEVLLDEGFNLNVPADGHTLLTPSRVPEGAVAIVVDVDDLRAVRWLVPDQQLSHRAARIDSVSAGIDPTSGDVRVTVVARDLVRDLALLAETHPSLAGVRVDRQLLTLLPGESVTFTVSRTNGTPLSDGEWRDLLAAGTELVFD